MVETTVCLDFAGARCRVLSHASGATDVEFTFLRRYRRAIQRAGFFPVQWDPTVRRRASLWEAQGKTTGLGMPLALSKHKLQSLLVWWVLPSIGDPRKWVSILFLPYESLDNSGLVSFSAFLSSLLKDVYR